MSDSGDRSGALRPAPRWTRLALAALCAVLFLAGLGSVPLTEPDEGRYTEIPREMLASGDFVTPRLNGVLYLEKPPLYYWLNAASFAVFGVNEFSARLWSALLGLAGVWLAFRFGAALGGERTAILSALTVATAPLYVGLGRFAVIDMTLSFFMTLALISFWLASEAGLPGRARRVWWYGLFAGAAFAMLAKGLVGVALPGAVIVLYVTFARRWSILRGVPWLSGGALFFGIAAPWHVLAAQRNPDFLYFYFVREHFLRYTTAIAERHAPFWFFVPVLLLGLLPWCSVLPSLPSLLRSGEVGKDDRERRGVIFAAVWAGFVLVFFSLSRSKLVPYILPAIMPSAALAAVTLAALGRPGRRIPWAARVGVAFVATLMAAVGAAALWAALGNLPNLLPMTGPAAGVIVAGGALLAASVTMGGAWIAGRWLVGVGAMLATACAFFAFIVTAMAHVAPARTARDVVPALRANAGSDALVYGYRAYPQSVPPYLGRTIGVVGTQGELAFGISKLGDAERRERFPSVDEFCSLWDSDRKVFIVVERKDLDTLAEDRIQHAAAVVEGTNYVVLSNR